MIVLRVGLVVLISLLAFSDPASAQLISFSDGDFDSSDWSSELGYTDGSASFVSQTEVSGGNPGAYRSFEHTFDQNILVAHYIDGLVLAPEDHSEFLRVEFSIDGFVDPAPFPFVRICFGLVAEQGGELYRAWSLDSGRFCHPAGVGFETREFTVNLSELTYVPDTIEDNPSTQSLDLSGSGAPIQFGVSTENSGASAVNTRSGGFDNVEITVFADPPVPSVGPLGLGLLSLGLVGLGMQRTPRRRRLLDSKRGS